MTVNPRYEALITKLRPNLFISLRTPYTLPLSIFRAVVPVLTMGSSHIANANRRRHIYNFYTSFTSTEKTQTDWIRLYLVFRLLEKHYKRPIDQILTDHEPVYVSNNLKRRSHNGHNKNHI